jgi:hypothetical protein
MIVLILYTLPLDAALLTIDVAAVVVSETLLLSPRMAVTATIFGLAMTYFLTVRR